MKFRKLTEKSFIGFGIHKENTVQELFSRGKKIELVDIYFNMSHITFFDNILDDLKISPEWRIEKPGVDKEKGYDFKRSLYSEDVRLRRMRFEKRERAVAEGALKGIDREMNSKEFLMNRNRK